MVYIIQIVADRVTPDRKEGSVDVSCCILKIESALEHEREREREKATNKKELQHMPLIPVCYRANLQHLYLLLSIFFVRILFKQNKNLTWLYVRKIGNRPLDRENFVLIIWMDGSNGGEICKNHKNTLIIY